MPSTLVDGQRLGQPTFHALYEAMPPGTRAELINGVVLMPSPVGQPHGRANLLTLMWLGFYQANTPGVEALVDTSTALGRKREPQPDALLRKDYLPILSVHGLAALFFAAIFALLARSCLSDASG
jgi:hypothetical protein